MDGKATGVSLPICHIDDLPDPGSRGFDAFGRERDRLFIIRRGDTLHAYIDRCPHYGATPLPWRKDAYLNAAGTRIVCASHGAEFDIATGACTLGPCLGQALQAVPLRVDERGAVYAAEER